MGLSPSKMVIDKLSDASARASREGREDIQCILSDDDFIDSIHGLWQQIPSALQSRIIPSRQIKAVSHLASQRKCSAAMLATYKNRGNRPPRCKVAATLSRHQRRGKPETTAYKTRKRPLYLQTVSRRQKQGLIKASRLKRRLGTPKKGQMEQTMDIDEIKQLVETIRLWNSDIPGFFGEEEASELNLHDGLVGTYRLLRHLEQRIVRDEARVRLLKVLFHRLLEKVCNQYARPGDLKRVTRIISLSGLVKDDSEQIGKRINSWGKIGRRLDLLCKDLSDGPPNEQHLGILFRLPKKMSDNYLEKLGYKGRRRRKEIEQLKSSGLGSNEKFKEIDGFADRAFSYLWESVQAAIIQHSLPVDEQLLDESTESDRAEPQTGSSHQMVIELAARTASVENRCEESLIQPTLSQECAISNTSPLAQPLQSDIGVQLNGAMSDQMEDNIWPYMQRIRTADNEEATATTNQFPLDQNSVLHNRNPGDAGAQLHGFENCIPCSFGIQKGARILDRNMQSDLSLNTPAENHLASEYHSCLVDQSPGSSNGDMNRHLINSQCDHHYIAPMTALEA